MRTTITRTIITTTIESALPIIKKNEPITFKANTPIVINGEITEDAGLKAVRKAYGTNAMITDVSSKHDLYEISVEDFMKYAKKVEPTAPVALPANEGIANG